MTFQRGTALDSEMAGLRFGRAGTRTCTRGTQGPYATSLSIMASSFTHLNFKELLVLLLLLALQKCE